MIARPRLLRRPPRRTLLIGVVALVVILGGGWVWFRSSSLVTVDRVTVTGLSGPDVPAIRSALVNEAVTMTTLDYSVSKLQNAVSEYPFVHGLDVNTGFPHRMTIEVIEQIPIASVTIGHRQIPVDSTGLLLPGVTAGQLPQIPLRYQPGGSVVTASGARAALRVLAAAPYTLLTHIASATWSAIHGVIVQLRSGPQIYFGTMQQLARKWQAATAVLANSNSVGAQYIDVSDPTSPAAGGGTLTSTTAANSSATVTTPVAATTSGATGTTGAVSGATGTAAGGTGAASGSTGAASGSTGATAGNTGASGTP